jgi:hypothetical protein
MNQQRLNSYLNLIQALLNCPQGEEWTLLQQNEELISSEFVVVMEQVAAQLTAEGNSEAAKFLHHWAVQLKHVLAQAVNFQDDKSQAYLNLIQALLDCPKGSEAQILAANQGLIDPRLVQMMQQVATQMASQGDREAAVYLSNLAAELGQSLVPNHAFKSNPETHAKVANIGKNDPIQQIFQLHEPPAKPTNRSDQETPVSPSETAPSPPKLETSIDQQTDDCLAAIAQSLTKLETLLASRLPPSDPLWYMNVLERAQASHWILTTEEVEQLIGVKPRCEAGKNSYQRGCWVFEKAGNIGSQIGWRVTKEENV